MPCLKMASNDPYVTPAGRKMSTVSKSSTGTTIEVEGRDHGRAGVLLISWWLWARSQLITVSLCGSGSVRPLRQ